MPTRKSRKTIRARARQRRKAPVLMTGAEFEMLRKEWKLTQRVMARFLDLDLRTVRRYASEVAINTVTGMLLRIMKQHNVSPDDAYWLATGLKLRA